MKHGQMIFGAPQFYVQGPGILDRTADYLEELRLEGKALVLIDSEVVELAAPLFASLARAGVEYHRQEYRDQITLDRVEALVNLLKGDRYRMVLGVGGGKAIDVAKRVGWALRIPMIAVPTSIATDAATSRTAVAYGPRGEIVEDKTLYNPAGVIVDSAVVVGAPVRLFCAGMADALSKRYEYKLSLGCGAPNWYEADSASFIDGVSRQMHEFLLRNGRYLKECFGNHQLNETVEEGITAMLLMSRLVWDPGGLRGAHDMFEQFHDLGWGHRHLHGEIVGYFDLVQLLLEGYPESEFRELYDLYRDLGIPLRISEMDFPVEDAAAMDTLAEALVEKCGRFGFHPGADRFKEAIRELEERHSLMTV